MNHNGLWGDGSPLPCIFAQLGQDTLSAIWANGALGDHKVYHLFYLALPGTSGEGDLSGVKLHVSSLDTLGGQGP